jgi:uncharacterized OB-fold protein
MNPTPKPRPQITALNRGFWEHAQAGQLAMQVCSACDSVHFPASPVCPNCLSTEQSWQPVSGAGTLQSWVAFHRPYWPGFAAEIPYDVCLVRLAEGPLMVSNIMGGLGTPKLGDPVHVVFDRVDDALTLPKFAMGPKP